MEQELKIKPRKQIVMLFGYICSGKTTTAKTTYKDHHYIKVSNIVKELSGFDNRQDLQNTASLKERIAKRLIKEIKHHDKVVVDGIRQLTIVHRIQKAFTDATIKLIWIDTPIEECRKRFKERGHFKDNIEFHEAFKRDNKLGLTNIRKELF